MKNNEFSATNNKTRNYGIDLLRLVAMFMVVILHILGQGGVLSNTTGLTIKGEIYWSIEITCYCAVNVYAIISGYVGYQSNHKSSNIIKLCLQLVFYSVIITVVSIISAFIKNESISLGQIMLYLFPTIDSYWYFSAYFCLFFFMPILNTVINNSDRHMLKKAGVVIFIIFCCWTQIYEQVSFLGKGYSVLWLSILYMLGAYIKKYDPFEKLSKRKCFVGYILFILITIITRIVIGIISKGVFDTPKGMNFLVSYTSPTIVISAVLLFCGFSKLNVKENFRKIISFFVPMSFGVYLIHCHPYIYNILNDMFVFITEHNIFVGILEVIVFGLSIFFVCLLIDKIRLIIFKLIKINKIVDLIENTFKKLSKKL